MGRNLRMNLLSSLGCRDLTFHNIIDETSITDVNFYQLSLSILIKVLYWMYI